LNALLEDTTHKFSRYNDEMPNIILTHGFWYSVLCIMFVSHFNIILCL